MRNTAKVRVGVSVAVVACALAVVAQAFGAVSPKLTVASNEATNTMTISYEQGAADDALASRYSHPPACSRRQRRSRAIRSERRP
jgi:hypothetical protein